MYCYFYKKLKWIIKQSPRKKDTKTLAYLKSQYIKRHYEKNYHLKYSKRWKKLSNKFVRKNHNILYISELFSLKKLNENFIVEFCNIYPELWFWTSMYQKFSDKFIRENKNNLNWGLISKYQKLSEEIIEENKNLVDWDDIVRNQNLSINFIRRNKNYLNFNLVKRFQKIPRAILDEIFEQ